MATQLDLNNTQHVAIRKLAADIYCRYVDALENGLLKSAERYLGMAMCLRRFAMLVLKDDALIFFCIELERAIDTQSVCFSTTHAEVAA